MAWANSFTVILGGICTDLTLVTGWEGRGGFLPVFFLCRCFCEGNRVTFFFSPLAGFRPLSCFRGSCCGFVLPGTAEGRAFCPEATGGRGLPTFFPGTAGFPGELPFPAGWGAP